MKTIYSTLAALLTTITVLTGPSVANATSETDAIMQVFRALAQGEEAAYQRSFRKVKEVATTNNHNGITAQIMEGEVLKTYIILNPVRVEPEKNEILMVYGPNHKINGRNKIIILVDSNMDGMPDYSLSDCATGCVRATATEDDRIEYRKRILIGFAHIMKNGL